jgi:plasmid maintenance system antidote protein VapI
MYSKLDILKGLHPGFYLAHELQKRSWNKRSFALAIGEYPQTLGAVTKGRRRMNTELALKIEQKLGLEEGILMVLQVFYDIGLHKQQPSGHPDLAKLRPALFWDTDIRKINWEKHKRSVIQRVNERGTQGEKEEISRFYGQ